MARRGLDKVQRAPAPRGRRQPRWEVEQRRQRLVTAVGAAVLLFILALPVWGYITTFVVPPRKVIANVNGTTITMGTLLRNLRVFQRGSEASGQTLDLSKLPFDTLNRMVEDELLRQLAPVPTKLNVSVTNEEVDQQVRSQLVGSTTETDPKVLETDFQERLRQYLIAVQLSEEEYRVRVRADLLRQRATEAAGREVPPIQPQVHLYELVVANDEALKRVQDLAKEGTPFEELLDKYEVNVANKQRGGEVGWFPRGILGANADKIFDLKVGDLSEPGTREDGTIAFVFMKEKADAREVQPAHLDALKRQALQAWIDQQRKEQEVNSTFSSADYDWVVKQLRGSARALPNPAGGQR